MKRIFFEKDKYKDFLFLIKAPDSMEEIYNVNNFTDEMGREYVYTLVGNVKSLNDLELGKHLIPLAGDEYQNFKSTELIRSPVHYINHIIDYIGLNFSDDIFLYIRDKKNF